MGSSLELEAGVGLAAVSGVWTMVLVVALLAAFFCAFRAVVPDFAWKCWRSDHREMEDQGVNNPKITREPKERRAWLDSRLGMLGGEQPRVTSEKPQGQGLPLIKLMKVRTLV
jgi:hypothetical protein